MNLKRLLLGGLLAGLLFNVLGIASALVFDLAGAFSRVGWQPEPWVGYMHLAMRFGLGIVAVFLYAAMRPRFGAGPKTSIVAGLCIWFVGYLLPGMLITELGVFEIKEFVLLTIWGLIEAPLATTAGAWVYAE